MAVNGAIYRLIADVAHDRLDLKSFHAAAKLCRRGSPRYFETLARLQPENRDELRIKLLERGLLLQTVPQSEYVKQLLPPLIRLGRTDEAATFAELALSAGATREEIDMLMSPESRTIVHTEPL